MDTDLIFFTGLAFLFVHELDAIQQHEWRFFFAPTSLNDTAAYQIFAVLHTPLFVVIVWYARESWFQAGFDVFLIIHAGLRWALRRHLLVTFDSAFSRVWIFGGALIGAIHLVA